MFLENYYYESNRLRIFLEIKPYQKYEGETRFNSSQILDLIEEGKWIGKYEGLEL